MISLDASISDRLLLKTSFYMSSARESVFIIKFKDKVSKQAEEFCAKFPINLIDKHNIIRCQ